MNKIYELIDELENAVKEKFPDCSTILVSYGANGYRNITVVKWGEGTAVDNTPRRELLEQSRFADEWGPDRSAQQNEYYDAHGLLLKD